MSDDIVEVSLLPCPFCGLGSSRDPHAEQVQTYWHTDNQRWTVFCEQCHVETACRDDRVAAAELWNTRLAQPSPDKLKAERDALVERYRHKKRGAVYEVIGVAELQAAAIDVQAGEVR